MQSIYHLPVSNCNVNTSVLSNSPLFFQCFSRESNPEPQHDLQGYTLFFLLVFLSPTTKKCQICETADDIKTNKINALVAMLTYLCLRIFCVLLWRTANGLSAVHDQIEPKTKTRQLAFARLLALLH